MKYGVWKSRSIFDGWQVCSIVAPPGRLWEHKKQTDRWRYPQNRCGKHENQDNRFVIYHYMVYIFFVELAVVNNNTIRTRLLIWSYDFNFLARNSEWLDCWKYNWAIIQLSKTKFPKMQWWILEVGQSGNFLPMMLSAPRQQRERV